MTRCGECVPCGAVDCDEIAFCRSAPGHEGIADEDARCEAHDVMDALESAAEKWAGRDPFYRPSDDDDPWTELASESRRVTDRFWSTVGDRPPLRPSKDAS